MSTNNNAYYYKGLNGLRAISVFLVIAMHLQSYDFFKEYHLIRFWPFLGGNAGVNLFFCISGFLITEILIRQKLANKLSLKVFIIRRTLRIFPLYYFFLAIVLLLTLLHVITVSKVTLLASAFYFSNFLPVTHISTVLGHTWSLAVEEHFYLLWPIIFIKCTIKAIGKIILLGVALCILAYFIIICFGSGTLFRLYQFTIPAILPILFGSYLAYFKNFSYKKFEKMFSGFSFIIPVIAFLIIVLFPSINSIFFPLFNSVVYFFMIGYLVQYQNSRVTNFLEYPALAYIGKISYGLYIWQGFFIGSGSHIDIVIFGCTISKFPINLCLTFIFSVLSYHFFEQKFLKLKDRYFNNK